MRTIPAGRSGQYEKSRQTSSPSTSSTRFYLNRSSRRCHESSSSVAIAEELFPILASIFPPGSETLNFIDYTPSRIVKRQDVLQSIPAHSMPSVLIYTLQDDNIGVLPQLMTHPLATLTHSIQKLGGMGIRRVIGCSAITILVLRILRGPLGTRRPLLQALIEIKSRICSTTPAIGDMLNVFSEVEAATVLLEWHGLGVSFTTPTMMMQHWQPSPMPPELDAVATHYQAAH